MSTSIYGILAWSGATTYNKWDIVSYVGTDGVKRFWYSSQDSNLNNTPGTTSAFWNGNVVFGGQTKPQFFFSPSYNPTFVGTPKVNEIVFGDGYRQRTQAEINADLLRIELLFEKRALAEMTALLHFLHQRKSVESFVYTPPDPYSLAKLFVAEPGWAMQQPFFGNYNLRVVFQESAN